MTLLCFPASQEIFLKFLSRSNATWKLALRIPFYMSRFLVTLFPVMWLTGCIYNSRSFTLHLHCLILLIFCAACWCCWRNHPLELSLSYDYSKGLACCIVAIYLLFLLKACLVYCPSRLCWTSFIKFDVDGWRTGWSCSGFWLHGGC